MTQEPPKSASNSNEVIEISAWLGLADNDYIAARTLIRFGLLLQGTVLANTAIEKYLKTVCRILGENFETRGEKAHNITTLYKIVKGRDAKLDINESFLALLDNAYKSRYPDRLEPEYNLALSQAKTLVGLDETVHKIRNKITIQGPRPHERLEHQGELLLKGNHTYGNAERKDLFTQPLSWYEMRVLKNKSWMEAAYVGFSKDDNNYNLEGIRHALSDLEYTLQAVPVDLPSKNITNL